MKFAFFIHSLSDDPCAGRVEPDGGWMLTLLTITPIFSFHFTTDLGISRPHSLSSQLWVDSEAKLHFLLI